jgi:LCP family protein required for cell wall assembly
MTLLMVLVLLISAGYLLFPARINVLIFGIDWTTPFDVLARSDTVILSTFMPHKPYTGMLSIPRDLWVNITRFGENRINTAHYFAEAETPGNGPFILMDTIRNNFGVDVNYYVRLRFEGFKDIVDAMGGLDINLSEPAAGYEAGRYHLTGNKALAFARQRYGSDDFFRMEHGQLLIKSAIKQMMNPMKWWRLPKIILAIRRSIDTNVPVWVWPRIAFTFVRLGPNGIDNRTISREMVEPFLTSDGAQVLLPRWELIQPVLIDMFLQR